MKNAEVWYIGLKRLSLLYIDSGGKSADLIKHSGNHDCKEQAQIKKKLIYIYPALIYSYT